MTVLLEGEPAMTVIRAFDRLSDWLWIASLRARNDEKNVAP
jgi:hypothetical protein